MATSSGVSENAALSSKRCVQHVPMLCAIRVEFRVKLSVSSEAVMDNYDCVKLLSMRALYGATGS